MMSQASQHSGMKDLLGVPKKARAAGVQGMFHVW